MELSTNSCSVILLFFVVFVITQKVECESMLVTVTETTPDSTTNSSSTEKNEISKLEDKIENLSFNLRYMQEVVVKWQKNFRLINERFMKLEDRLQKLSEIKNSEQNSTPFPKPTTITTTTTNSPRQFQQP